ncbi:MAG: helix-turn-helix transcriptional regulator [Candidatus Nanopelagicales bacterium]|nr:helix-turn-helix transcriptional regulator [Candidatus Nanopelagicales bacterium]
MSPSATRLVGRDAELDRLLGEFAAARAGATRSLALVGVPGAGLPALLAALRRELAERGLAHRWVGTRGGGRDAAYAPLAGLLAGADALRASTGLDELVADLAAVPVEVRPSVVGARLGRRLAGPGGDPLVLVVQRSDALEALAASALATTIHALAGTRALVLATGVAAVPWPTDRTIRLGPLPSEEALGLAAALAPADAPRAQALVHLSGGLPGLMVALSRWPDPREPAAERLAGLHPRGPAVALVAGLAEGHLGRRELLGVSSAGPGVVVLLEQHGVLRRREPDGSGPPGWVLPEPWWPVALATCGDEVAALAAATAGALAQSGGPARLRARALGLASDPGAAAAWREAASGAGRDVDARAEYLLRAWRCEPEADPAALGRARDSAEALLAVGRTAEALEVLGETLRTTPRRARVGRARLLTCQHRALLQAGQHEAAGRALAEAAAALGVHPGLAGDAGPAGAEDDPEEALARAEVLTLQGMEQVLADPAAAVATAEAACRSAERSGDPAGRAAALGALALARSLVGQPEPALFDHALALAEQAGDAALEARIAANRVFVLWRAGELAAMEASVAAELARLARTGLAAAAGGQLLVARAVALHGLGRWAELGEHLERTLAHEDRLGAQVAVLLRLVALELAADLGRSDEARAGLEALARAGRLDDPEVAYEVMAVRLRLALLAQDLPRSAALALVQEALELAVTLAGDPFAAALVRVGALRLLASAQGRPGGPVDLTEVTASPIGVGSGQGAGQAGEQAWLVAGPADGPAGSAEGAPVELRALQHEERALHSGQGWQAAIDAWAALPMPSRQAWAQVWAAHALAAAGQPRQALALLDAALVTARALAAVPLEETAQRLARALGRRSVRTAGQLTARERDVLVEVARGQTNREVARTLGMSDRTVAVHLSRIFAKLGAGTRGEAVHLARHAGELPEPGPSRLGGS